MPKPMTEVERRVVGVLIEKLLATPAYYPMTVNSLTAGCNQKNNRDPELTLSEESVHDALASLQGEGLVVAVLGEGARVEKWKTAIREPYRLPSDAAMAVLAELLLRGPQTKAELRAHASRMRHEIDAAEVDRILDDFSRREDPLAVNIGRAPGGRAERYAHTLYAEEEMARIRATAASAPARPAGPASAAAPAAVPDAAEKLDKALKDIESLNERVAALERSLAEVRGAAPPGA